MNLYFLSVCLKKLQNLTTTATGQQHVVSFLQWNQSINSLFRNSGQNIEWCVSECCCHFNVSLELMSRFLRAQLAWMTSIGSRPWAQAHLAEWCSSNIKGRTNSSPWRSWTNRKCVTVLSNQQISPCMYWRLVHWDNAIWSLQTCTYFSASFG